MVNNWPIVMEGTVAATNSELPRVYFIMFWVFCVVVVMNVLVAFFIDAYQAHVDIITKRMKAEEKKQHEKLHGSGLGSVRGSFSTSVPAHAADSNSLNDVLSMAPAPAGEDEHDTWRTTLNRAAKGLGYDISAWEIWRERGVGDFYHDLYRDDD